MLLRFTAPTASSSFLRYLGHTQRPRRAEAPPRRRASYRSIIPAPAGRHVHVSVHETPQLMKTSILLIIKPSVMSDRRRDWGL